MSKLHKELNNDVFVPDEGQRDFLCNNKSSLRCPSSGFNQTLSDETIFGIKELGNIFNKIHNRLLNEGYIISDGKIYKNEN